MHPPDQLPVKYPGTAVVLDMSPTGLTVARSLSAHGVTVYGVDERTWEVGHFSKTVRSDRAIQYEGPGSSLADGLVRLAIQLRERPVLFVAGDKYLEFVAEYYSTLKEVYVLTESMRPEALTVLLDKRQFYEKCRSLNVPLPQTFFPASTEEATHISSIIRYPAIVKPVLGYLVRDRLKGRKLVEVSDSKSLVEWWDRFREWGTESVLQECIIGPESNIAVAALYIDRYGTCLSAFTAQKIRQYPPIYGSGSYVQARWYPQLVEDSVQLLRRLNFHGVCGTEYKLDERDGVWKMVEVNCRPVLWYALSRVAGIDVVWDAYSDLCGHPNPIQTGSQNNRKRWQLIVRDVPAGIHAIYRRSLSMRDVFHQFVNPRNRVEAVFAWDDWRVNVGYVWNTYMHLRSMLRRS